MSLRNPLLALAAFTLLLAGCGDEKVTSYRVPKEKDPEMPGMPAAGAPDAAAPEASAGAAPAGPAMADTAVPTAEGAALTWPSPAGWVPKAATAMRKGTFAVPGDAGECDLSITAFPGDVGGELANVNRWRSQIGMTPLRPEELEAGVSQLQSNGLTFTLAELLPSGDAKVKSILGAMVPFGGGTWFFKLTGPKASVQANRDAFLAFLHGVKAP